MPPGEAEVGERARVSPSRLGAGWRLAFMAVVQLGFLAAILLVAASYTREGKLTSMDLLALPGERIVLRAKIERDWPGFPNPDLPGVELEFVGPWQPADGGRKPSEPAPDPQGPPPAAAAVLGAATSGRDGVAQLDAAAPAVPGNHFFWVRLKEPQKRRVREPVVLFTVSVMTADEPILLTDMDNTIVRAEPGDLQAIVGRDPEKPEPAPGAAQALSDLSRSYRIVYLTARSSYLAHRTRRWLAFHHFPAGAVLFRDLEAEWRDLDWSASEFKKRVIRDSIKSRFHEVRWGVGNTAGDAEAYAENGVRAVILGGELRSSVERFGALVKPAADWSEAKRIIAP
jgi:hypothetical protein